MMSRNVEAVRAAYESFNRRDFDGLVRNMVENIVYTDKARDLNLNGKQKFLDWCQGWIKAFPDGHITNIEYIDAGDVVVTQFTFEGTNNGPFAGMPPTGRRVISGYCEVSRFDNNGRTVSGVGYYDLYTMLTQLGHIQPLSAAA